MALIDEARSLMATNQCATCALLASNKKLAAEIQEALDDSLVPVSKIVEALGKRGVKASSSSLSKHRKFACPNQVVKS